MALTPEAQLALATRHLTAVLGRGVRELTVLSATEDVAIVAVEDPDLEAVHVATLGLSTQAINALQPTEFVCSVREGQVQAAHHLVSVGVEMAARGAQVTVDSQFANATPLLQGTDIRGLLLSPGLWFPELDLVETESGDIDLHVVTLLPLISADIALIDTDPEGADAIYERIEHTSADLLDVTRSVPI
ncbi:suppressor of fused domain protein [Nakamurella sp. A5-74]|uniref:Suppressor of fused domain protein n=1 Tax=Nakamurella sp. A5-74 TaxID=3158264 RepID=A0AAU8DS49_9ACTN